MKKIISLLLVSIFVLLPIFSASAAVARASIYFNSYSIGFLTGDDGVITIRFNVTGVETSTLLGVSTFEIQRSSNGSWSSVTSWLSGKVGYDVVSHSFSKTFYGTPGEKYRVHCIFVCENSAGYGTQEYYSGSVTARQ